MTAKNSFSYLKSSKDVNSIGVLLHSLTRGRTFPSVWITTVRTDLYHGNFIFALDPTAMTNARCDFKSKNENNWKIAIVFAI